MKSLRNTTHLLASGVLTAVTFGVASTAQAFSIAQSPLFLSSNVKPNLILGIDDSGSMDSEVLFDTNDGALWWNTDTQSFVGLGRDDAVEAGAINYNEGGGTSETWQKYVYMFPNGAGDQPARTYDDGDNAHYAIPPRPEYAFARAPYYNKQYYDPERTYRPWAGYGGTTFDNSPPTAAPYDPIYGDDTDVLNLTADLDTSTQGENWDFRQQTGMRDADGDAVTAEGNEDYTYYPATYYVRSLSESITYEYASYTNPETSLTVPPGVVNCSESGPAEYKLFESGLTTFTFSDGVTALGPDGACLIPYEVRAGNTFPFGSAETRTDCAAAACTYEEEIRNFANWFTYYRRRHHAMRAGIGQSFDDLGGIRVDMVRFNNRVDVSMLDIDTERSSFMADLYNSTTSGGGTPTRQTLDHIGDQYQRTGDGAPIEASCQQNFAVVFTDGFANTASIDGVENEDGAKGEPYADDYSDTLGDIAMKYYENAAPLRTDLNNGPVPVRPECNVTPPDPSLDCNQELHMNTYAVTLGALGNLFRPGSYETVADAYDSPPTWENPNISRNPVMVDDLYHAAVNGRGEMLSARNPLEIESAMDRILGRITDEIGSAAAVAANSTRLDTDTLIYLARFDSTTWAGDLLAFDVNTTTGAVASQVWSAASLLDARTSSRNIFTFDGSGGTEFTWANLTDAQKTALGGAVRGEAVVDFLRGDRSCEQQSSGCAYDLDGDGSSSGDPDDQQLRQRGSRLGDIVNSEPAYSGMQDFGFGVFDSSYNSYVSGKSSRTPAVFVGANDGMLHAFNGNTGDELFAYVPRSVIPGLDDLASPAYAHQYFVDGSPVVIDAKIRPGGTGSVGWHTVLLGTTGAGGRAVFALDVSDVGNFSEDDVIWEIDSSDDSRLGVTIPQPSVARFEGNVWVALVPNGYNSTGDQASLLVVDLEDGDILAVLETGVGSASTPNGLGPVVPVDQDFDGQVDFAYAGDMLGNLWRFEFGGSASGTWSVTDYDGVAGNGNQPLFTACSADTCTDDNRQPITARPSVTLHPDGGIQVLFGTGSYFQTGDNSSAAADQIQTFYGIRDLETATPVSGRSALQEQTILAEGRVSGTTNLGYRVTSDNAVTYATQRGWYLDLAYPAGDAEGERVVNPGIVRDERIIFTSLIPETGECSYGGSSWLMVLDAINGARLDFSPLDTNNDATIDDSDLVALDLDGDGDTEEYETSGKGYSDRIVEFSEDGFLDGGDSESEQAYGSASTGETLDEVFGRRRGAFGRQSWFQVSPPVD